MSGYYTYEELLAERKHRRALEISQLSDSELEELIKERISEMRELEDIE